MNAYVYVTNNPIAFRDPLGLDKDDACAKACKKALDQCTELALGATVGCIAFCYVGCAAIPLPAYPVCTRTCSAICTAIGVNIRITCSANYGTCLASCS